ncbi:MAG: amidohydrolase family protein [Nitrospinae bacterium]|nr:amidohydrolase family protein [Nitrospinota bacterium]
MARHDRPSPRPLFVTARHVIVDPPTVIERGAVSVTGGKVAAVGPAETLRPARGARRIELGDAILHPGFINAHCHLELSFLKGRMLVRAPFTDWIRELVARRGAASPAMAANGIREGAARLIATGTSTVGDIATTPYAATLLARCGLRAVVYHEVTGFDPARARERFTNLKARLGAAPAAPLMTHGVSPHAVYSVSPELMELAARHAWGRNLPLAIHLAETPEEEEFSRRGVGPFRALLEEMGLYAKGREPGARPALAAARSGALRGALAIHMNHPSRGDLALLAREGAAVALCPNSNAWFGRDAGAHPLPRLLERGVTVALGTDSLASNTDIDLRAEARAVLRAFPRLSPEQVFAMMTVNGARALGLPGGTGTLRPGAPFDAAVTRARVKRGASPLLAIIGSSRPTEWLWVEGRAVRRGGES